MHKISIKIRATETATGSLDRNLVGIILRIDLVESWRLNSGRFSNRAFEDFRTGEILWKKNLCTRIHGVLIG